MTPSEAIFTKLSWFFHPPVVTNKDWATTRDWRAYSPEVQEVFQKVSNTSLMFSKVIN